jgi:hypothetical protein
MIKMKKIQLIQKANTQWIQDRHQHQKVQMLKIVEEQRELISSLQILMVEQTILQQKKVYHW